MIHEDTPIKKIEDDEKGLNRANFAKNLASNIENYFNRNKINNCLTIGLMGEWGSGKTSLLNLIEIYLKKTDIKIIKFNPWLYSSYNQLVEQFFDELIIEFTASRDITLKGYLRQYKLKVHELDLAKNLAIAGTSLIDTKLGGIVERTLKPSSKEDNLKYIKKKIDGQLSNRKVVCIIDDLDRLSKKEIAEMFKLIKIMADFKNLVYLVSFDEHVVSQALKENYGEKKFLEKIINVPLYVPLATTEELKEFLLKEVKRISQEYEISFNENRLNGYLKFYSLHQEKKYGIIHFFKNIRDIKRFINIFEFNIGLIKDEVNFTDFFVLTAIEVFRFDVYDKIKYNEYLLTDHHYYDGFALSKDEIVKSKIKEFEELFDDENISLIIKKLFPMMSFIYKPNHYYFNTRDFDEQLLICHPNHFKSYFKLNEIIKEIPEKEINEFIEEINSEKSLDFIFNYLQNTENEKIGLILRYLQNRLKRIQKKEKFIEILYLITNEVNEEIYWHYDQYIEDIIINLLYKINKNKRFPTLKKSYTLSNNYSLMFDVITFIERNNFNKYTSDEKLLDETEIKILKEIIKETVKITSNTEFEDNFTKFRKTLIVCSNLDLKEINDKIISKVISTDQGTIQFLKSFLPEQRNSSFLMRNMNEMNNYIDVNIIKNRIDKLPNDYTEEQIVKNFLEGYKKFKPET